MKDILLILAAIISAFGFYIHIVRGNKLIVTPMLKTDLHHVSKHTLNFSWEWGAVTMVVLTLSYLAPVWRDGFMPLAMMATLYGYALGALSFITMRREGFRLNQMPQWVAFWAASVCGLIAWGVL
ncbi:MAG: tetrahydromethanopterin S-methyltransferase subunit E [Paracoccaceae bacterium]|jgi:tetrahydromethanopterin S-methyltransferase subunit E